MSSGEMSLNVILVFILGLLSQSFRLLELYLIPLGSIRAEPLSWLKTPASEITIENERQAQAPF